MTWSFGRQTFGQNNGWSTELWPGHLVDRHLADTMFHWESYFEGHLVDRHLANIMFGWPLTELWPGHLVDRHLARTMVGWWGYDLVIWLTDIWLTQCLVDRATLKVILSTDIWPTQCLDYTAMDTVNVSLDLLTKCVSAKWLSIKRHGIFAAAGLLMSLSSVKHFNLISKNALPQKPTRTLQG